MNEKTALVVGGGISAIVPQNIEEAFRLAGAFSASGLAPASLNSPEKVMIAILAGAELGLPPFQALQSFAVINGRPTLWGDGMLAVVRANGVRVREWLIGDGDDTVAHCETIRPNGEVTERTFSTADAKKAGLLGKSGPWQQYPKRMLGMRARAFALRDGCADILRGMQMYEEVADYEEVIDNTPAPRGPKKVNLRDKLAASAEVKPEGFERASIDEAIKTVEQEPHDPDTGEVIEGEVSTAEEVAAESALPTTAAATTETDGAPPAEEEPASSESADPASSDTQAAPSGLSPEEAAAKVAELQQTVSGGAGPGDDEEAASDDGIEPEVWERDDFAAFWKSVPVGTPWLAVKKALPGLYNSAPFKALSDADRFAFRSHIWTARGKGNVDQATDPTAFMVWIYSLPILDRESADAIRGTLDMLTEEEAFKAMPEANRKSVVDTAHSLMAKIRKGAGS